MADPVQCRRRDIGRMDCVVALIAAKPPVEGFVMSCDMYGMVDRCCAVIRIYTGWTHKLSCLCFILKKVTDLQRNFAKSLYCNLLAVVYRVAIQRFIDKKCMAPVGVAAILNLLAVTMTVFSSRSALT